MAGSYDHCVAADGQFLRNEDFVDMIENLGDAFEACEEMYGMIWLLASEQSTTADPAAIVADAWRRYDEGLRLSPGVNGRTSGCRDPSACGAKGDEDEMSQQTNESTMRKWRTLTRCGEHGLQASVTVTFGLQRPREVVLCPPVCPQCENVDGPQAAIVSIEAIPSAESPHGTGRP